VSDPVDPGPDASPPEPSTGDPTAIDVEGEPVAKPEGKRFDGKLGCLITLIVGIACVALAWAIMRFRTSANLDAAAELAQVVMQAENADGTEAMRDAGCEHAAALPTDALRGIAQRLEDDRAAKEKREAKQINLGTTDRVAIVCGHDEPAKAGMTCAKAAQAFAASIKNVVLPIIVIVEAHGVASCTQEYTGDPEAMKDLEALAIPSLFSVPE